MSLKLLDKHQIIRISDSFQLAYKKVNYEDFDQLEKKIEDSVFSFDRYYRSIKNLNRKFEWLSIRELLLDIEEAEDISYDEHGKPHFKDSNKHLSISHSVDSIAVSVHRNSAHGIDLQHLNPKIKTIRDKFLREEEVEALKEESAEELSILWSMKEALFKLNGKKDIFLKGNIRLSEVERKENEYFAKGEIINIENPISAKMKAFRIDDYVLAYTLIP